MPIEKITVMATADCLVGDKHLRVNEKTEVDADMFGAVVPGHLTVVGRRTISDKEVKAAVQSQEEALVAEKEALIAEAKDLQIRGVHKGWGIEKLREAVIEAKLALGGEPVGKNSPGKE